MTGPSLTWVSRTPNTKTGDIPTAYVGATLVESRATCRGCPLLDNGCYAWTGMTRLSMGRLEIRREATPDKYTLEHAIADRDRTARAARIGALGDPGHADRAELLDAVERLRAPGPLGAGLAVISYTHFWGEAQAAELRGICMASCEDVDDAVEARKRGWTPAVLLPWDQLREVGPTFRLPDGSKGVVCPAQTKDAVTCNSCRMCSLSHPVWDRLDFPIGPLSSYALSMPAATCHPERRARCKGMCTPCYSHMIYEKRKDRAAECDRRRALARFGLTPEDYEEILEAQGGCCAICQAAPTRTRLCVDHDHQTTEVRGLLCHECNKSLGLLADDPYSFRRAIRYLQKPPTEHVSRPQAGTEGIGSDPVRRHLWAAHGMTLETFEILERAQKAACAICQKTCSTGARLSVDHVHDEGAHVRGLLCKKCNRFVGLMKDDPDRILAALAYLCSLDHPVWKAGKVSAIGFLDHSVKARTEQRRAAGGKQLPMFGREGRDVRPASRTSLGGSSAAGIDPEPRCQVCSGPIPPGRRRKVCSDECRARAQVERLRRSGSSPVVSG